MIELILIGIIVILVLGLILVYNGLIGNRNRVENAWSQIDVQLKRRFDLIPNLIESVKGYAKHEKEVFTEVTKARAAVANSTGVSGRAQAENMLTGALKSLFAVAEAYPQLRASENFQQLQEELSSTESKIAYARQFYNDAVLLYNNAIQQFPSSVIAGMFGFAKKDFFEAEAGAREAPKVKF